MQPGLACSHHTITPLAQGWTFAALEPDLACSPSDAALQAADWIPAQVPGTAAGALRTAGRWSFDSVRDFDAEDGWWRCEFARPGDSTAGVWLRLDGLATLAEVWLNSEKILDSNNQFLAHEVEITNLLRAQNLIYLRCASLGSALKAKRARPRWKTRLVAQQQLRWHRTTLLGRIPGWSPPVAATGPWRSIALIERRAWEIVTADFRAGLEGTTGLFDMTLMVRLTEGLNIVRAVLHVGEASVTLQVDRAGDGGLELSAGLRIPDVALWWPHTHGSQALHPVRVVMDCGPQTLTLDCGRTGFRSVMLDTSHDGFALCINGTPVFCRGACWTTLDIATLEGDDAQLGQSLDQIRDAGFNLLRIGGTMVYESSRFYEACAQRGIMVWQDYCFANMDYPGDDAGFAASVREEASQFLTRTQLNPALCVLCGNSEIEQQVAMLGQPQEMWQQALFADLLPSISRERRPDVPYITSSPTGGALPFQVDVGLSHYYGVGAYLRPLEDARRAGVRFTSECLAFANVPEPETLELFLRDGEIPPTHPRWKARVPRDSGPGWDFDDVRDHYLNRLFGGDAVRLRYTDVERYLYLSRLVSAEIMVAAMSEWRRADSTCRGALIWFWRDLWPGAGWGLVDSTGLPKAPYYALKRTCAPIALLLTDEGLNGLALHAVNDTSFDLPVRLQLSLYRRGEILVASAEASLMLAARSGFSRRGDALLGRFADLTHSYRFGPPGHDVTVASLIHRDSGEMLGQAFHVPDVSALSAIGDTDLSGTATAAADGSYEVRVRSSKFAHGVWLDARGFVASDNYFHLAPGASRKITLHPRGPRSRFHVSLLSTTTNSPVRVTLLDPETAVASRITS